MENAQCGYRILIPMPSEVDCEEFQSSIMGKMQNALINSFKDFSIPQSKINAYICESFYYFHFVKAKPSRPSQNAEEFAVEVQQMYKEGKIRSNTISTAQTGNSVIAGSIVLSRMQHTKCLE